MPIPSNCDRSWPHVAPISPLTLHRRKILLPNMEQAPVAVVFQPYSKAEELGHVA